MNISEPATVALFIAAAVFLVLSSVSSASAAALARITRAEASAAYANGNRGALKVVKILNKRAAASAALTGLRFLFISAFAISATVALSIFYSQWWHLILVLTGVLAAVALASIVISPAAFGGKYPVQVLGFVAPVLLVVASISDALISDKDQTPEETEQVQEDQLALMVERVSESDALDENERELLQSLFDMGNTLTREVMVPRTDMISIHFDQSLDDAIHMLSLSGFSRLPVTGADVDDLRGIVYLKDIIKRIHHRSDTDSLTVADVMREPRFVPETKVVDDLMRDMQANQIHIAMVVDEYGGIAGLVTIEDLVEELVGEIADEHDRAELEVETLATGGYRIPARLPIDELGELFGIELDDDDVDTAGGLFAKVLGRVPINGAHADISGIHLEADRFVGRRRRLTTILASRSELEEVDEENE